MIGARVLGNPRHDRAPIAAPGEHRVERAELTERPIAFERLTEQRLLRAYRLAALILGNPGEAEDAVHDAAVIAWTRFAELRNHDRFEAWFDRIVVNVCRQRRRPSPVRSIGMDPTLEFPLADGASGRAERDALRRALGRLTPEHRMVVVLRHLEGYSITEIADRTGEREGTAKSRLHYALRELRAAYDAAERGAETQP